MRRICSKTLDGKLRTQRTGVPGFSCEADISWVSSGLMERVERMSRALLRFLFWEGLIQLRFRELPLLLHGRFSIHSMSGERL